MALTFFKLPKHKRYNYKPVYWDKAKEEREKRMKAAVEENHEDYASALRDRLEMRWKRNTTAASRKNANMRLVVILFVIFMVVYFLFFSNGTNIWEYFLTTP